MTNILEVFLGTSTLGVLRIGSASSSVESWLGITVARTSGDDGVEIWKYGPLQLTVASGELRSIRLDCLDRTEVPAPLQELEILTPDTTPYALVDALDQCGIAWEIDPAHSFDRQLCIRTEGGVRAYFDVDHRELQSLQA
jgi:hypothetical protein